MKRTILLLLMAIAIIPFVSCKKDSKGETTTLPNISGNPNNVLIVLHKELWADTIGKTYMAILEDQFPYLPQAEPLFDVTMVAPEGFGQIFKTHRNIIQNNVTNKVTTPSITIKRDLWAAPQTVVIISGPSYKQTTAYLLENKETLVNIFEQAERDRYVQTANKYSEVSIVDKLSKKNISMSVPKGFSMNSYKDDFIWFSMETPRTSQGIIIFKFPYTSNKTFTAEYLNKKRNEFVAQIPGPTEGSYMITSDVVPPSFSPMMYKKQYRGVLRGFWDVYNHPMGGPFIAHIMVDEARQEVLYAEAYVYAPNKEKRELLRQTEALLFSIGIKNEPNNNQ